MASPLGRSTTRAGAVNGSGRGASSLSSIPQTLSEKLEQEVGPLHDGLSGRLTAAHLQQMHYQAVWPPSGASATNSPQASGPHGFYLDADEDGEERMPILSTWREPLAATQAGWLARQVKAALLGLVLGLVAVIPTVLWLTGRFDAQVAGLQPYSAPAPIARLQRAVMRQRASSHRRRWSDPLFQSRARRSTQPKPRKSCSVARRASLATATW